jgi:hypothetical protein
MFASYDHAEDTPLIFEQNSPYLSIHIINGEDLAPRSFNGNLFFFNKKVSRILTLSSKQEKLKKKLKK